jgi:[ribosomal protein S5]-alanine N-acetyltransferase
MHTPSENIELRQWTERDIDQLNGLANNAKIFRYMTDGFPFPCDVTRAAAFIDRANNSTTSMIRAIEWRGKVVGGIGLHLQSDIYRYNAELGYWIGEPYWGKGIATKAVSMMCNWGLDHLDIQRIYARPFASNLPSQRVLIKSGFVHEATLPQTIFKNNQWEDEMIFGMNKEIFQRKVWE